MATDNIMVGKPRTFAMLKSDGSLRSDIFLADGMHLNPIGYALWDPVLRKEISSLIIQK